MSAWHDGAGDTTTIATNYAFRTEQQSLARISTVSQYIDSGSGSTTFCDAQTAPPVCTRTLHVKQWYVTPFEARGGTLTFDTSVEAIGYHIDGVLGLSPTTPRAFTDLAAIARFNPDGYIDARDGNTYRADRQVAYTNGGTYDLRFVVDTAQHRSCDLTEMC